MGRGDSCESVLPTGVDGRCHDGYKEGTQLEAATEGDGEESDGEEGEGEEGEGEEGDGEEGDGEESEEEGSSLVSCSNSEMSEYSSSADENVKYIGLKGKIIVDNIKIDLITRNVEFFMNNDNDNVKILSY